ncbi:MAG: hypothetical protein ACRBN8_22510 [Nannocystales bacterium]
MTHPRCCYIDRTGSRCEEPAYYSVTYGDDLPGSKVEACDDHLGHLIGHRSDHPEPDHYRVTQLGMEAADIANAAFSKLGGP